MVDCLTDVTRLSYRCFSSLFEPDHVASFPLKPELQLTSAGHSESPTAAFTVFQVADYIPQLAKFSPELWAVSLCTVDGQR